MLADIPVPSRDNADFSDRAMPDTSSTARARAVLLVVAACFLLAGMDALGKHLMQHLPAAQVVWARYSFHTLLVGLAFGLQHRHDFLRPRRPGLQLVRGLCLLGVTFGIYLAIRRIPLGDATAILFLAPILVTLLAARLLHEAVRPLHWLALGLGLAGVLLILRPGFGRFDPVMLLPLGSALLLAFYFVLTRLLRHHDSELTTLFHTTVGGTLVMSLAIPLYWVRPAPEEWPLLALMGLMGAGGHLMLIRAFRTAGAAGLSPWLNTQILAASLYGAWLYGEPVTLPFLAGAGLIVAGGLVTWRAGRSH